MADQSRIDEPAQAAPAPPVYSVNAIHLVRTTQQINLSLSQMADTKASILMGATFLVFTLAVGQASNGTLSLALGVMALFAFVAAMCAVFAVLPAVSSPASVALHGGKPNHLFFGHFTQMDESVWTNAVLAELRDEETMFRLMLHDVYQNGQVLQRKKYKYLAYAYKSFMAGLCLTVVTAGVEFALRAG